LEIKAVQYLHGKTHEPSEESDHNPTPDNRGWPCIEKTAAKKGNDPSEQGHSGKRNRQAFEKGLHAV